MVNIPITVNEANSRLDRLLRKKFPLRTLSDIYKMIRTGFVRVNGKRIKENHRLLEGDILEIRIDEAELVTVNEAQEHKIADISQTEFYKRNLKIVYEDDAIIACNKPPHLVVHSGTGHEGTATLIDLVKCYMKAKIHPDKDADPVLVHRLDRDTSGIILIAKNKGIVRTLHTLLREHDITKHYIAVCHGTPQKDKGIVEVNMAKSLEINDGTKMTVDPRGVYSKTEFMVLAKHNKVSKIKLHLFTGRTHQIRVHMSHIGCPVVGDVRYGSTEKDSLVFKQHGTVKRLYLHANLVSFVHPTTNKQITLTVPEPEEFSTIMRQ